RGTGPSLTPFGVANALQDPTLELHDGNGATIATNDNWRTTQIGGIITNNQAAAIQQTGAAPGDDREPANLATLTPGNYTAIVRGKNNSTGIGVVEAYDLDQTANSKLANIASRGFLDTGDNAVIAGFIIAQPQSAKVIIRAIAPSLSSVGVTGALQDPTLDLRDGNGTRIVFNNDWQETQKQEIIDTGIPPVDARESAIVRTLAPGNYTAIVRGNLNATGIAVVEVYDLTP
ncbi:MAG TPA: hypothetical protein VH252_07815, partial [Chthoniobacterales bacterium]|nr:hypothetical protein [Chthoniobacterales bacterium]